MEKKRELRIEDLEQVAGGTGEPEEQLEQPMDSPIAAPAAPVRVKSLIDRSPTENNGQTLAASGRRRRFD